MSQPENWHDAISLLIEGMTCVSYAARAEKGIKAVPGVTDARENLATERATVRGTASAEAVIAAPESSVWADDVCRRWQPYPTQPRHEEKRHKHR